MTLFNFRVSIGLLKRREGSTWSKRSKKGQKRTPFRTTSKRDTKDIFIFNFIFIITFYTPLFKDDTTTPNDEDDDDHLYRDWKGANGVPFVSRVTTHTHTRVWWWRRKEEKEKEKETECKRPTSSRDAQRATDKSEGGASASWILDRFSPIHLGSFTSQGLGFKSGREFGGRERRTPCPRSTRP